MRAEDISEKLQEDGYVVLPDYLKGNPMKELFFEEVGDILSNSSADKGYKFGKAERIGSLNKNSKNRIGMSHCFTTPLLEEVRRGKFKADCKFTEIFVTHEFTDENGLERNGYLHFDRIWTFKYFYYITDTRSQADGPLTVVPGSHVLGKKLRKAQLATGAPYKEQKNRIEIDFPLVYEEIKSKKTPLYGPAGTLVIFDTDVFHMGGTVTAGHERKVCRLHMR
tara:strand:- start:8753 stop:9421 length:669 start_codon:yes stop_codon:yes gene_type:complete